VENFCAAKPQKSDLQPVERTKCAMLQRLVTKLRFLLCLTKSKKAFSSKAPNQLSEAAQIKKKNATTVKTPNLLSNARIEPSFFQMLRSSNFPKRETKKTTNSSTCQENKTRRSGKPKNIYSSKNTAFAFAMLPKL
jgi:hypothetical protein